MRFLSGQVSNVQTVYELGFNNNNKVIPLKQENSTKSARLCAWRRSLASWCFAAELEQLNAALWALWPDVYSLSTYQPVSCNLGCLLGHVLT